VFISFLRLKKKGLFFNPGLIHTKYLDITLIFLKKLAFEIIRGFYFKKYADNKNIYFR
jgi:hypothetical protein